MGEAPLQARPISTPCIFTCQSNQHESIRFRAGRVQIERLQSFVPTDGPKAEARFWPWTLQIFRHPCLNQTPSMQILCIHIVSVSRARNRTLDNAVERLAVEVPGLRQGLCLREIGVLLPFLISEVPLYVVYPLAFWRVAVVFDNSLSPVLCSEIREIGVLLPNN